MRERLMMRIGQPGAAAPFGADVPDHAARLKTCTDKLRWLASQEPSTHSTEFWAAVEEVVFESWMLSGDVLRLVEELQRIAGDPHGAVSMSAHEGYCSGPLRLEMERKEPIPRA